MTKERKLLLGILAVAFLLRLGAGIAGLVITHDGARFTYMARLIDRAEIGEAMDVWPHLPPLYPLFIRLVALVFPDLGVAGVVVSIFFGALTVLPLYSLAKSIAGERIAQVATLIYAFLPEVAILGGEVMSEPTFLFFFLSWMALLWSAVREPHWSKFVLAGVMASAAYLTRPEGIYTIAGTVGWCALMARRQWYRLLAGALLFLIVFLVISWPYLLWIRAATGGWALTANPFARGIFERLRGKSVPAAAEFNMEETSEFKEVEARKKYGRVGGALVSVMRESVKVCFYLFLPLAVVGLALARRRGVARGGIVFLGLMMAGYGIPTVIALIADQPFGYRYIMPTWIFATPFMAVGALEMLAWLARWKAVPIVVSVLLLTVMAVKVVKPRRGDRWDLKAAGLWIRKQGPELRIASMDRRVEHYAYAHSKGISEHYVDLPKDVRYVVLYERHRRKLERGFQERLAEDFREVHRVGEVVIYEPVAR